MALRQSFVSGFFDVGGTWVGGVPPGAGDTWNINIGHVVTNRTAGGAITTLGGTIASGGTLQNNSTAGFTIGGTVSHDGTFGMAGSGSSVTPTLMTITAGTWTCGASAIWNVLGTLPQGNEDVSIILTGTGIIDQNNQNGVTGTFSASKIQALGSGYLYRWRSIYLNITSSFLTFTGNTFTGFYASSLKNFTIYSTGHNSVAVGTSLSNLCNFLGSSLITANSISNYSAQGFLVSCNFYDTSSVNVSLSLNYANYPFQGCGFYGSSIITVTENNLPSKFVFLNSSFFENSSIIFSSAYVGALKVVFYRSILIQVITTGLISISASPTSLYVFSNVDKIAITKLSITSNSTTIYLTYNVLTFNYWQMSRSIRFDIIGTPTSILHDPTSVSQYEPILYCNSLINRTFSIQYDIIVTCPNYTALYGTSTGWTSSTKTLAAGGILKIDSLGHTATGMDMAISSFAGFALATSGTATINTAQYYISFDGGILWSAALTAAQLQTNTYIINGNTYYTDPRYNIQLRIWLTSTLGGTVTQVRVTGITYNPAVTESWNVRWNFEQDEGVGFATGTDSLHQISTKIGTPISLSGGGTSLADNLVNMADNAGGAAFNSATDSLHELANAIAAIAAAIAALLAPILRGVNWLVMHFKHIFKDKIKKGD